MTVEATRVVVAVIEERAAVLVRLGLGVWLRIPTFSSMIRLSIPQADRPRFIDGLTGMFACIAVVSVVWRNWSSLPLKLASLTGTSLMSASAVVMLPSQNPGSFFLSHIDGAMLGFENLI